MENTTAPRFLKGDEALQLFAERAGVDLSRLTTLTRLKAYTGTVYAVYQFENGSDEPILLDKLKVVDMAVTRTNGPMAWLVSVRKAAIIEVSVYPTMVNNAGNLAISFPQRPFFERTAVKFPNGDISFGVSSCVQVHHRCIPSPRNKYVPFIGVWGNVVNLFSSNEEYIKAVKAADLAI